MKGSHALSALMISAMAALVLALGNQAPPATAQQAGTVELSLSLRSGTNLNCLPATKPDTCYVEPGTQFTLVAQMNAIPPAGYSGFEVNGAHTGLTSKAVRVVAPNFEVLGPTGVSTDSFRAGGITALTPPLPTSAYVGPLVEADLNCPATPGTFKISLPVPFTDVRDQNNQAIPITTVLQDSTKVADTLLVNCIDRATLDVDKDGDGCPNVKESQTAIGSERTGGRRDPKNPWDYFNPTKDGLNRVDDILAVVAQYFLDDPDPNNPDLTSQTDRTGIVGGNPWNLGPPNGLQRVDDILASVKQYLHDCP